MSRVSEVTLIQARGLKSAPMSLQQLHEDPSHPSSSFPVPVFLITLLLSATVASRIPLLSRCSLLLLLFNIKHNFCCATQYRTFLPKIIIYHAPNVSLLQLNRRIKREPLTRHQPDSVFTQSLICH